jgi:hypothetical protein
VQRTRLTFVFLLLAIAVVAINPLSSTRAAPDVREVTISYTDLAQPLQTSFMVEISGVGAGYVRAERVRAIVHDMGDGVTHLHMQQSADFSFELLGGKGKSSTADGWVAARLRGSSEATLVSAATGARFTWSARVESSSSGRCLLVNGVVEGCELAFELSGNLNRLSGQGTCGSFQQRLVLEVRRDTGAELSWYVPDLDSDSSGMLKVNQQCAGAVFGIMPGDNVSYLRGQQNAAVVIDGTFTEQRSGELQVTFDFEGALQDGAPIRGQGEGLLRLNRDGTASGDVRIRATVGEGASSLEITGRGRIELDTITLDRFNVAGTGTMKYLPSSTEGTSTD